MGHVIRAVWITLLVTVFRTCHGASTEGQIQFAADNMRVIVVVSTNHEIGGKYRMTIRLLNPPTLPGQQTMLPEKDWQILFHHQNRITPTTSKDGELILQAAESCLYVLAPKRGSKYSGIGKGQTKLIELEVSGLSIYKSIVYPNFSIYTPTVTPRNILSTADNDLTFVNLEDQNKTMDDLSLMHGSRRLTLTPDVMDQGRVPLASFVIPAPRVVAGELTRVMNLPSSQRLNYFFDAGVHQTYQDIFVDALARIQGVGRAKLNKVTSSIKGEDMINVTLIDPNSAEAQGMTEDGYNFTVTAKDATHFDIHLIAKHMKGLYNANATMFGIMGVYHAMPEIQIQDDASFAWRSVELDLTTNFFGFSVLKKFIDIMAMYKLNYLVLNLADNKGWRLEMAGLGFDELHTFGSRRCVDLNNCLPTWNGAGATGTGSSNGYFTNAQFKELIKYAANHGVNVIPKFNFGGGMLAAKWASLRRYDNIKERNMVLARQYLLIGGKPIGEKAPVDESCLKDAALNPCIPQTEKFIRLVNKYVYGLYTAAGVELKAIHAGGDEWVNSYQHYPECKQQQLGTPALLRKMVAMIQRNSPVDIIVDEELVIDTSTMDCIPAQGASGPIGSSPGSGSGAENIDQSRLTVVFKKDTLVNPDSLGLNQHEMDFLFGDIEPPPPPGNETAAAAYVPDFQKRYTGPKRGIKAPWGKSYRCANAGYPIVMNPEAYMNLDAANELSWDEVGNHKSNRYSTISRHRMMLLELSNININTDQAVDMTPIFPYRLCQLVDCTDLTVAGERNLRGLQASIDTAVIRTERTLWETTVSRVVMVAEKAWRRPPFENTLKPTDLSTYDNTTLAALRSQYLLMEMTQFLNTWGYKERGRLDAMGIPYRVGRVSAGIANGLAAYPPTPPPWQVIVKSDEVGTPIQFRDNTNTTWRELYWTDPRTGSVNGGYTFSFPVSSQQLELRLVSADNQRASIPTVVIADARNLIPPAVPTHLREDACLDVLTPDLDISKINANQWSKIINNIAIQNAEVTQFGQRRIQQLTGLFNRYKQFNREEANLSLMEVMNGIDQLMSMQRPLFGAYKYIYDQNQLIIEARERALKQRFEGWNRKYLNDPNCPKPKKA